MMRPAKTAPPKSCLSPSEPAELVQGWAGKDWVCAIFVRQVKQPCCEEALTTMTPRISLLAEIPEELNDALQTYLETHSAWSQHRVFCAALSLFLMQNGHSDRQVNRIYLDALFDYAA
jgi:Protein of unknown function (DUF2811)